MQKTIDIRSAAAGSRRSGMSAQPSDSAADAASPVPSVERMSALIDSLSHTLDCIKTLAEAIPNGPIRDRLETERANLAIGLLAARVTAMRAASGEAAAEHADKDSDDERG